MAAKNKRKTAARPKTSAAKTKSAAKRKEDNAMQLEMSALFTTVAGVLLAVFLYAPAGIVGEWLKSFFLGLLGVPAYVLPFFLIINVKIKKIE